MKHGSGKKGAWYNILGKPSPKERYLNCSLLSRVGGKTVPGAGDSTCESAEIRGHVQTH